MLENRKPRHIRDIAHLYISRPRHGSRPSAASVWIAGEDKRCFPGFHTANLAGALAAANCPVRLVDRSGLLPNAAYFMLVPPMQYLRWLDGGNGMAPGLGGIEIDCSRDGRRSPHSTLLSRRVELVHLPPLSSPEHLEKGLRFARKRGRLPAFLVLLVRGRPFLPAPLASVVEEGTIGAVCALRLPEGVAGRPADQRQDAMIEPRVDRASGEGVTDLGWATGWESALDDRVPAVFRAPDSTLSQAYRSAGDALLFEMNRLERTPNGNRPMEIHPGIGSGAHHR